MTAADWNLIGFTVVAALAGTLLMLPFGLADSIFSVVDPRVVLRTMWNYGKLVIPNLLRGKI